MKTFKQIIAEATDISEAAETGLAKKAEASGISVGTLRKVYNRGMAAWRTGHRPGTTPQQWAMARVNSYITKGKTYHTADKDLRESELSSKYSTGNNSTDKARAAHFKKGANKSWDDPSAYKPAPGDATAKTRESQYTKKYKQMYGEANENDGEYGQEGGMAKSQLRMMIAAAKRLHTLLDDDDELPGHIVADIVLATDYITGAADYMESEMADENDFNSEEE